MTPKNHLYAAMVAHEANRAWCAANGDMNQPTWEEAPVWQQISALNGVQFHIDNPDADDSASHNNWMAQKISEGWVYGKEKNPEAMPPTHPCIVPFDQLPKIQQTKDALFRCIVHAVIK